MRKAHREGTVIRAKLGIYCSVDLFTRAVLKYRFIRERKEQLITHVEPWHLTLLIPKEHEQRIAKQINRK